MSRRIEKEEGLEEKEQEEEEEEEEKRSKRGRGRERTQGGRGVLEGQGGGRPGFLVRHFSGFAAGWRGGGRSHCTLFCCMCGWVCVCVEMRKDGLTTLFVPLLPFPCPTLLSPFLSLKNVPSACA